jgi:myosin heavy subunit
MGKTPWHGVGKIFYVSIYHIKNTFMTTGTEQTESRKDNRTLIYGILVAALLGTWGYIIYDKNKTSEKVSTLSSQNTMITTERDEVRDLYNSSLSRLDSLMGENQNLADSVEGRNSEVTKMKAEIRKILANKNATAADLSRARKMINELNSKVETLAAEVDKLKGENQELTTTNEKITVEKQQVEQTLTQTTAQKDSINSALTETRDIASTLKVSNISITPINEKSGGKEKETTTAKKVDKLRIGFDLDQNRLAPAGEKELYVSITAPDGTPISIAGNGSGNFTTREEGEKFFTSKVTVQYENTRKVPVSFDFKQDKPFQTGDYKIEVYHNGFKIGEGVRSLKKGGLFG